MSAHFSDRDLKVLSIVGPVGNNGLQAVGVAAAVCHEPERPIVLCCVGDGTTQQGEFFEAVSEAVRSNAPVLFLVQDNRYSISTVTRGQTFFDLPAGPASTFLGLDILRADVEQPQQFCDQLAAVTRAIREDRKPRLCVINVERLSDHASSDDQTSYRKGTEIAEGVRRDPLKIVRDYLDAFQVNSSGLRALEDAVQVKIEAALHYAQQAVLPEPMYRTPAARGHRNKAKSEYTGRATDRSVVMRDAIRGVLTAHLERNPAVILIGQDIEDPKGDVFGVTRGLSSRFPTRVKNAALSESTIVGTAIGRALAGQRPIAFIQFADFIPLALNQIISELATMSWRTNGRWNAPVILMVSCGGYKPGLGPFHAQTFEGILAHVPGIDLVMPSSAGDAAGLLNNALISDRPTVFLYPKALLNVSDCATSDDLEHHHVQFGVARLVEEGCDLTLVSYGNCLPQCRTATHIMSRSGMFCDLIDLRSIAPWDKATVIKSVEKTRRLVVVHEDNRSVGFGAEVLSTVVEMTDFRIQTRRVTRPDTHIPYNFPNQTAVLPSVKTILEACGELIGFHVEWVPTNIDHRFITVSAIGSGPADEEVVVREILCVEGQHIVVGDTIAVVEATKSAIEIASTVSGRVHSVLCGTEQCLKIGDGIILVEPVDPDATNRDLVGQGNSARPVLHRVPMAVRQKHPVQMPDGVPRAYVATPAGRYGSRVVSNSELLDFFPGRTAEEIERLTGIAERRWVARGETVVSLAVDAVGALLHRLSLTINDIDLAIASTGTPDMTTPSLACRVVAELAENSNAMRLPAFDINAACAGYLFALALAYDHLRQFPNANVLVITSEVLSPLIDQGDFQTAVIFADGASATLVRGTKPTLEGQRGFWLERPILSGMPESGALLRVPIAGCGTIRMEGGTVFSNAVRMMHHAIGVACDASGLDVNDLSAVVPHQANQRIIDALGSRLHCSLVSTIRHNGNTSSSSIPLALVKTVQSLRVSDRIGMVAFGGGFTVASAIGQIE